MQITLQNLIDVKVTQPVQQNVVDAFNSMQNEFAITVSLRIAHFMAQVCHESGGFRTLKENLFYTNPHRLMVVWPKRFTTLDLATQYINDDQKLGNFVYANRNGNGNVASGDGFRFRGRGPIQTTGRAAYQIIGQKIFNDARLLDNPDLLLDISNGLRAALIKWTEGNCNALADLDDIKSITKFINGGVTGLDERKLWLADWKHALTNNPA